MEQIQMHYRSGTGGRCCTCSRRADAECLL